MSSSSVLRRGESEPGGTPSGHNRLANRREPNPTEIMSCMYVRPTMLGNAIWRQLLHAKHSRYRQLVCGLAVQELVATTQTPKVASRSNYAMISSKLAPWATQFSTSLPANQVQQIGYPEPELGTNTKVTPEPSMAAIHCEQEGLGPTDSDPSAAGSCGAAVLEPAARATHERSEVRGQRCIARWYHGTAAHPM